MLDMVNLVPYLQCRREAGTPLYIQIADGIAGLIQQGILPPGVRIPTSRELSRKLNVHRKTIVAAYQELQAQGWIQSKPRKYLFVSPKLPEAKPVALKAMHQAKPDYPDAPNFDVRFGFDEYQWPKRTKANFRFQFNDGFPDVRLAPINMLLREYHSLGKLKLSRKYLTYSAKEGSLNLRQALANDLRQTRGMPVTGENILVTKGAQMAIFIAASIIVKPGDVVVVGEPGYFVVNLMLNRMGARIVGVPVDTDGMDIDAVEEIARREPIRMIYVIPHHHHPTTVTLSPDRRLKLLALAERNRIAIVEDDYDFDLHYDREPVLPMASADRAGNVVYIGTLSKVIAPSIRIGYMVAPREFIRQAARHRFLVDMQSDSLLEEAMALLYRNGTIHRHLKKIRRIYKERRDVACDILASNFAGKVSFSVPAGGMSIWLTYVNGLNAQAVSANAAAIGLSVCDGQKHNTAEKKFNSICLGFASLSREELREALGLFDRAVSVTARQSRSS